MSVLERLIDRGQPAPGVIVQGATGRVARQHIRLMRGHGTRILAGVAPGKGGQDVDGLQVFEGCAPAVAATGAEASVILVPPLDVLAAVEDALAAGIRLLVTVSESIPVHDMLRIHAAVRDAGARWVGASSPGLAVPGHAKLGFLPEVALRPGPLAVWSKSGTLSYETCLRLAQRGIGQSAWIGVGGDPVKGTRFADLLPMFRTHDATRAILIIGEIGGDEEEELAAALTAAPPGKPVYAVLAGSSAPEGVTMGHAGAIIRGGRGTMASKTEALRAAGVEVFTDLSALVDKVARDITQEAP